MVLRWFKADCRKVHWSRQKVEWIRVLGRVPAGRLSNVKLLVRSGVPPASVWRRQSINTVGSAFLSCLSRDIETMRSRFRKQKRADARRNNRTQRDIFNASKSYTDIGSNKVDAMFQATVFNQPVSSSVQGRLAKSWCLDSCLSALRSYPDRSMQ